MINYNSHLLVAELLTSGIINIFLINRLSPFKIPSESND